MKNHNEMYQSLLSRYEEHQEKKKKRILTIKRTVPALACFCFCAVLGIGYWKHFRNLPSIPVQPDYIDETTLETPETTTSTVSESKSTTQVSDKTEPTSTTAPISNSETERMTTTAGIQTQTVTTVATDATETPTTEQVVKQTETQAPATTPPATYTQPITDPPVITTVETQDQIVTEPITTTDIESPEPFTSPAQPLSFRSITDMKDAIQNNDVSSYSEQEQEVYRNMFDRIKSDGFLYHVNNTDTVSLIEDRGITLLPYASYEDVGIGCYVTFNEKNYHITFYYADRDLIAQTNSIAEYLQSRMGRRCDKEINVSDSNVSLFFADNGQTYAGAFIDPDHYYTVNTVASEEEMVEFIEALSFEPLPLV